jgi:SnoaL-like protein
MTTTTEQLEANKKLARDYIDQVFNQHNPSKAADFVTADVVWHGNSLGDIADAENLAGLLGSFIGALPDLYAAEHDITAENGPGHGPARRDCHGQGQPAGHAG